MISHYRILIFSSNPDKLMKFYQNILGLKLESKLDIPNDYGYMFALKDDFKLWIGLHDKVKGKSKEPFRLIHNFYVKSVTKWYQKIKNHKHVKIILKPELTPFATKKNQVYVCTWLDPDGNCWQFMGKK